VVDGWRGINMGISVATIITIANLCHKFCIAERINMGISVATIITIANGCHHFFIAAITTAKFM
jgi:hypothetical protein